MNNTQIINSLVLAALFLVACGDNNNGPDLDIIVRIPADGFEEDSSLALTGEENPTTSVASIDNQLLVVGDSLLVNGGFENHNMLPKTWKVFKAIDAWATTSGAGVEVQNGVAGKAYEGGAKIELDSHGKNSNSSIKQEFKTSKNTLYRFTFAYSPRAKRDAQDNKIEVRWNGQVVVSLAEDGSNLNNTKWTVYSYDLSGADGVSSVEFQAMGRETTYGGYIDGVSVFALASKEVNPKDVEPIVVDNVDAKATGDWVSSTVVSGFYGKDYLHNNNTNQSSKSMLYPIALTQDGYWQVFARWTQHANRATNAVYTVSHSDGDSRAAVNQRINGDQWNNLGVFRFEGSGKNAKVTLDASPLSDGHVIADAIKLVYLSQKAPSYALSSPFVIDNTDTLYVKTFGTWASSSAVKQYEGEDYLHDGNADDVSPGYKRVVYTPEFAKAGKYKVYVRWTSHPNRATNAGITVNHASGRDFFSANQKLGGGSYIEVGTFEFKAGRNSDQGSVTIQRPENANGYVIADALKFEAADGP